MNNNTKNTNSEKDCNKLNTVTMYQVDGIDFSVQSVFKENTSRTLGSVLFRLMTSKN